MTLHHEAICAWLIAVVIAAAAGCSGEPKRSGDQPYGAGTNAREPEPEAGSLAAGAGGAAGIATGGVGGSDEPSACEMLEPGPIGACVVLTDPMAGEHVSLTGVVESVEPVSEVLCDDRALGAMIEGRGGSHTYEIAVRAGEELTRIQVRVPWSRPRLTEGETVSVEYKAELPPSSVGHGDLVVRNANGALILWVAQAAHGFDSVQLPELTISDDMNACATPDPCGTLTHGSIRAFDRSTEASIAYGESAFVGHLVVLHGDNTAFTSDGSCSARGDFHRVVLAALRVSESSLGLD